MAVHIHHSEGLCPWMGLQIYVFDLLVQKTGIDLGGGDIGMAQHLLNGPQVRPILQQMGGKGVAQGMALQRPTFHRALFTSTPWSAR